MENLIVSNANSQRSIKDSSSSIDKNFNRGKTSGNVHSESDDLISINKRTCAHEVLDILREPKIIFKVANKEFNDLDHIVDVFIQKRAFFYQRN
jgi:hypothetical protein